MNARDTLVHRLNRMASLSVERSNELIDAFAHELADEVVSRLTTILGVGPYSPGILALVKGVLEEITGREAK